MCDLLFIVDALLIPFSTLSESEKMTKFCSESTFWMIFSVTLIANASAVKVDAIVAILNFQLILSLIYIATNLITGLFSIFVQSVTTLSESKLYVVPSLPAVVILQRRRATGSSGAQSTSRVPTNLISTNPHS